VKRYEGAAETVARATTMPRQEQEEMIKKYKEKLAQEAAARK
jgi:hypothetical protein